MSATPVPPPVDYQPVSATLPPSLVRTLIPYLAGLVGTWILHLFGVDLGNATVTSLLTAGIGYLYYVAARLLEVFGSDKWGYILGFRSLPVYAKAPLPSTVVATDDTGTTGDRGAVELGFLGLILAIVGLVGLVIALIGDSATWTTIFAIVFVAGVVLAILRSNRRGAGL